VLAMGNATVESAALAQGLARFFYAANPADTSYPDHKHVPDFFVKVSTTISTNSISFKSKPNLNFVRKCLFFEAVNFSC
jgi:hypothetical protein